MFVSQCKAIGYYNFAETEFKGLNTGMKRQGFFYFENLNYRELFNEYTKFVEKDLKDYAKNHKKKFYDNVDHLFSFEPLKQHFKKDGTLKDDNKSLKEFELNKDSFALFSYHDKLVNYTIYNLIADKEKMVNDISEKLVHPHFKITFKNVRSQATNNRMNRVRKLEAIKTAFENIDKYKEHADKFDEIVYRLYYIMLATLRTMKR